MTKKLQNYTSGICTPNTLAKTTTAFTTECEPDYKRCIRTGGYVKIWYGRRVNVDDYTRTG